MNAHIICRLGTLIELEVKLSKEDTDLDRTVLDRLKELAQVGAEMQCRLYLRKLNGSSSLVIQLDEPQLPEA